MKKRNKNNKKAGSKKAYLPKYKPCKDRDPYKAWTKCKKTTSTT